MRVVILCGGQGTRIRDVSEDVPKPMIRIGEQPILWHIMKTYSHFGFRDFVVCLGYKSWSIKRYFLDYQLAGADFCLRLGGGDLDFLANYETEDWRVTCAETGIHSMTGYRLKAIEKYIDDDTFMLTYGDGLADIDLSELLAFHRRHGKIATVTTVQPPGRFGELQLDGQQVVSFSEKPVRAAGWISGGFFVFEREIFERLPSDPGLVLEQEPLRQLSHDGELVAFQHTGFWQAMDNSREFHVLNELWSSGQAPWQVWKTQTPGLRLAS